MATQEKLNKKFIDAAVEGNVDTLQDCINKGAHVNCQYFDGWTPLHLATISAQTDVVYLLLKLGAFLSVVNIEGQTPLHTAAMYGQTVILDMMLQAGGSLSVEDYERRTPLHKAAWHGRTKAVVLLLDAGASLSVVDIRGQTPLHIAAMNGHTEEVNNLLKAGASTSVVEIQGKTPYEVACGGAKDLIRKYMDKLINTDEIVPMMNTNKEVKELLLKGTFRSYENCVFLAGACNAGKTTLASILIGAVIPQLWKSTDGLTIYFGRNGIDLKSREMVPLNQGFDGVGLSKVILGKPAMIEEKHDTTLSKNIEEVLPQDSNKGNIDPETDTVPQLTNMTSSSTVPTPSPVPGTGKEDIHTTDPFSQQLQQNYIIATFQEDIKKEIRKETYKIEIVPSDLVDFGGQKSFDMTHQLFIRYKGTFVLMFNGNLKLVDTLKEYSNDETTKSILKHWVNSILSYCVDDEDIVPIILFCATHSDVLNKEERIRRKAELISELGEMFKDHKQTKRIECDTIYFINGMDKHDPEIKDLKTKLVDVAFQQNTWGRRIPMAWVPLDQQITELRRNNMNIISKEELITLNLRNEDLALTDEQLKNFLIDQHSLGKILYFDQQGLDHFIIVQPQSLVHILRSFITAKRFWPKDKKLNKILSDLTDKGIITRENLFKLWLQETFHQHLPNDYLKEFIIQVLVHLDILVEPNHYKPELKYNPQSYLVPCIVKHSPPKIDIKSADKMICLSYTLLKSSIPAALSFKLIGAAMNWWPLKETDEGICLYHQAAILRIDDSNDLHLLVEDGKVFVYLINTLEKDLIPRNIALTVQECLTFTMTKVLEFYHKSFGKSLSTSEVSKTFEIKVGEWCTSGIGCYISVLEAKKKKKWLCKKQKEHDTQYPLYWILHKKQVKCPEECNGLASGDLVKQPTDKHFFRLAKLISLVAFNSLLDNLEVPTNTWSDLNTKYKNNIALPKFFALREWRKLTYQNHSQSSFQELSVALPDKKDIHFLCQVIREDVTAYGVANNQLQATPGEDVLEEVAGKVEDCAIHLGLELGLEMPVIDDTLFTCEHRICKQTLAVMKRWISTSEVKTIHMLMKAFHSAEPTGYNFLREKYSV